VALPTARLAVAVEHKLVTSHAKPFGDQVSKTLNTSEKFEDLTAAAAVEVMMMALAGHLIARCLPRQLDGH
jgi:hypothetical protein